MDENETLIADKKTRGPCSCNCGEDTCTGEAVAVSTSAVRAALLDAVASMTETHLSKPLCVSCMRSALFNHLLRVVGREFKVCAYYVGLLVLDGTAPHMSIEGVSYGALLGKAFSGDSPHAIDLAKKLHDFVLEQQGELAARMHRGDAQ